MKVLEKSLKLNVGAELLALLRGPWRMPKAYLRGLTQHEDEGLGNTFSSVFPRLGDVIRLYSEHCTRGQSPRVAT